MELRADMLALTIILLTAWPSDGREDCLLDLTQPLNNDTLHYPENDPFKILNRRITSVRNIEFETAEFCGSEHDGTHIDAPRFFNPKGYTIDTIPLQNLEGPAVVINITDRAKLNPDAVVTVQDLKDWEKKYGKIPENSIIVMNSGYSKYFSTNSVMYYGAPDVKRNDLHYPTFAKETCDWIIKERSIVGIGVDTLSTDPSQTWPLVCQLLLSKNNKFIVNNLANVDKLPASGAYLRAYPMKISGGSAAPTRVIATLPSPTA